MITFKDVNFSIAGKELLNSVSFAIRNKQKIGLIGRNGSGKSTLFKLILKEFNVDAGKIEIENGLKILAIKQEIPKSDLSVLEYVVSTDLERSQLFKELEFLETMNISNQSLTKSDYIQSYIDMFFNNNPTFPITSLTKSISMLNNASLKTSKNKENKEQFCESTRVCEIYDRLIQIDAYCAHARASIVLNGLGFDSNQQEQSVNSFSGGFKMRIELASILFQEPDLLLLDEPTNHLDLETTDWLEDFLKNYTKSFLLISHDRDFLNDTTNYIFHLKNSKLKTYTGNFEQFLENYTLTQANLKNYNEKQESKRKHMMDFVNRFRAKATKAKQAQSRLKAIEKMKFMQVDEQDPTVSFNFPEPAKLPPPIMSFEKITLGYEDKIILKNISGAIYPNDRIALVGNNGNGKSTFAKFLAGKLQQKQGKKIINNKLHIGFYMQDQLDQLPINITAFEHLNECMKNATNQQIRTHLGNFGFSNEKADQLISSFSGGEKARLVFATLTISAPELLILDEPTNHLDLEMRESLINTLNTYNGAVIIITHDKNFLKMIANTIYVIKDSQMKVYDNDIYDYNKEILKEISNKQIKK